LNNNPSKAAAAKGNPAAKRMSNDKLKAKRARSWARGQQRKKERREAQLLREQRNRELRAAGELTPWEQAKARAKERKN